MEGGGNVNKMRTLRPRRKAAAAPLIDFGSSDDDEEIVQRLLEATSRRVETYAAAAGAETEPTKLSDGSDDPALGDGALLSEGDLVEVLFNSDWIPAKVGKLTASVHVIYDSDGSREQMSREEARRRIRRRRDRVVNAPDREADGGSVVKDVDKVEQVPDGAFEGDCGTAGTKTAVDNAVAEDSGSVEVIDRVPPADSAPISPAPICPSTELAVEEASADDGMNERRMQEIAAVLRIADEEAARRRKRVAPDVDSAARAARGKGRAGSKSKLKLRKRKRRKKGPTTAASEAASQEVPAPTICSLQGSAIDPLQSSPDDDGYGIGGVVHTNFRKDALSAFPPPGPQAPITRPGTVKAARTVSLSAAVETPAAPRDAPAGESVALEARVGEDPVAVTGESTKNAERSIQKKPAPPAGRTAIGSENEIPVSTFDAASAPLPEVCRRLRGVAKRARASADAKTEAVALLEKLLKARGSADPASLRSSGLAKLIGAMSRKAPSAEIRNLAQRLKIRWSREMGEAGSTVQMGASTSAGFATSAIAVPSTVATAGVEAATGVKSTNSVSLLHRRPRPKRPGSFRRPLQSARTGSANSASSGPAQAMKMQASTGTSARSAAPVRAGFSTIRRRRFGMTRRKMPK
jgi:hypothetical protein